MEIKSRGLNQNELFCCTKNDIKKVLGDNDISVSFAYFRRHFETNPKWYKGPKIKGKIIASLSMSNLHDNNFFGIHVSKGHLDFYVLKEGEYSEELKDVFITKILPKIYNTYKKHEDIFPEKISGIYFFSVELFNNKFIIHEGIEIP